MNKDLLNAFIKKIAANDPTAREEFSTFVKAKGNEIVKRLDERTSFGVDNKGNELSLNTDGRLVLGNKLVATIHNDLNDFEAGINLIFADGSGSKEFETFDSLTKFIRDKFLGEIG